MDNFVGLKLNERPNLTFLDKKQQYEFTGITRNGKVTMMALLLFGIYPQTYYPQLSIIATAVPGTEMGCLDSDGKRFIDSKRIEGTLPEMLDGAIAFVRTNMKTGTRINPVIGERADYPQYPLVAVREAVLNALVHRDYSLHTQDMPIQLVLYEDRLEIINPGGLYGRLTVDQLGHVQGDTRNPSLVTGMETLGKTENRYSGIPTIRYAMQTLSLPAPVFLNMNGFFNVTPYNSSSSPVRINKKRPELQDTKNLLDFCHIPRSREEIVKLSQGSML